MPALHHHNPPNLKKKTRLSSRISAARRVLAYRLHPTLRKDNFWTRVKMDKKDKSLLCDCGRGWGVGMVNQTTFGQDQKKDKNNKSNIFVTGWAVVAR